MGITLEVAATLVPHTYFLPMICKKYILLLSPQHLRAFLSLSLFTFCASLKNEGIGNICKAMCGVAAGACGGAIDLYWATGKSDISEVNAKFSAQVRNPFHLGKYLKYRLCSSVLYISLLQ